MLKEDVQPVTKKDQKIFTIQPMYIPMELVVEGEIIEKKFKRSWNYIQLVKKSVEITKLAVE